MKRVMIVEDEEFTRHNICKALSMNGGIEVFSAANLEEAEKSLMMESVDTLVTDLDLDGRSHREGLDLLRFVGAKFPRTRVIVISGHGSKEVEDEVYKMGGCFYFEKPVDLRLLRSVL